MIKNSPLYRNKNLLIIYSITLIGVMGVASIAPALPKIIAHFHITEQQVAWLITVFTLPGIFLTPVLGIVADRIGRKKVLIPSLLLFSIAGTVCAFIDDFGWLLVVRFFQGVGASSIGSLNVTLIGDIFEGPQRAKAMGYNASVLSIFTASYPALGGMLAGVEWNFPFLLPILAMPVAFLVLFGLDNTEPKISTNFKKYFSSAWKNIIKRDVISIYSITFLIFIVLYGSILTYTPILLKEKFSAPPGQIGILLSVMSVAMGTAATQIGRISKKLNPSQIIKLTALLYAVSLFLIPVLPSIYWLVVPLLIYGFGNGLLLPTLQTLLAGKASLEQRGIFMSFNGMVLRLGQSVGPLITGLAYAIEIEWAFWISIVVAGLIFTSASLSDQ